MHASEAIDLQEDPRPRRATSATRPPLFVALREVAQGRCAAAVSAGNPGAAIAASLRELTLLPGVAKVAMASVYPRAAEAPGQDPLALTLDVGATVRCTAEDLVRFAVMGSTYARVISRVAEPRVALLNMGRDPLQGDEVLTTAHRRLRDLSGINFVGNIEGHELTSGRADVVVCEGLLGNIVLKLLESVANMAVDLTTSAATQRTWRWRAGMAIMASGTDRLRALADYASYGGARSSASSRCSSKPTRAPSRSDRQRGESRAKAARDGLVPALKAALADGEPRVHKEREPNRFPNEHKPRLSRVHWWVRAVGLALRGDRSSR